jgi:site-specific recombinase XerD
MKKIISPKSSQLQTSGLRSTLKKLVLEHHDDVAALDIADFQISEAWALSGDRVKVSCELKLKSGRYRGLTRVVSLALPPETKTVYRDWTITIKPTWFGFRYQLLDESGAAGGESSEDVGVRSYAEENAKREVDRLVAARVTAAFKAPASKSGASRARAPKAELLPAPLAPLGAETSPAHPCAKAINSPKEKPPSFSLPALIARTDERARWRFIDFFTANIRNKHTRRAYYNAVTQFFDWIDGRGLTSLEQITPFIVAAYIEQHPGEKPSVKQHLAAIRMLFDWLVVGQVMPTNPATSVRGPKYVVTKGKTPVLDAEQARELLASVDTSDLIGLRDRALIGVMVFTFARVSAVTGLKVEDYYQNGKRWYLRFHEKGGKHHEVQANRAAEEYLDAYLEAAGLWAEKKAQLFQSIKQGELTGNGLAQQDVYRMIQRRALAAGTEIHINCHTWRGTGLTAYLSNGGALETAQKIAGHSSPRTTKLYDRTGDDIPLDEVERIRL